MGAATLRRDTVANAMQSATTSTVVKAPLVRASLVKWRYTKYHLHLFYNKTALDPAGGAHDALPDSRVG